MPGLTASPDAGADGARAWEHFHERVGRLQPPLAPHADVVRLIGDAIGGDDGHVLLLGMTSALFRLGRQLTAVDWSEHMIATLWPGDVPDRRALCADWRAMMPPPRRYSAVIGDGSLNTLPDLAAVASVGARLALVAPGAQVALRCFLTPEPDAAETLGDLARAARKGPLGGFHAFKWRLAMALCHEAGDASIAVTAIVDAFDRLFPDRAALARSSGWSEAAIAEIDAYRDSAARYCFPTAGELLAVLDHPRGARFLSSGRYELAERCPLLVWRLPE